MKNLITVKKYLEFANHLQDLAKAGTLVSPHREAKKAHVGANFVTHLLEEGYLKKDSKGTYVNQWDEPFTEKEIDTILVTLSKKVNTMRKVRREKIQKALNSDPLVKFTSKELIEELRRRGYKGTIYVQTETVL